MDTSETDKEFFEWHEANLLEIEQKEVAERVAQSKRSKAEAWLQNRAEAKQRSQESRERFHYQSQYGENLLLRSLGIAAGLGMCFIVPPGLYGFYLWIAGNR